MVKLCHVWLRYHNYVVQILSSIHPLHSTTVSDGLAQLAERHSSKVDVACSTHVAISVNNTQVAELVDALALDTNVNHV